VLTTGIISEFSLGPDNPAKKSSEPVIKYARAYSRAQAQAMAGKPERPKDLAPKAGPGDNKGPGGKGPGGKGPGGKGLGGKGPAAKGLGGKGIGEKGPAGKGPAGGKELGGKGPAGSKELGGKGLGGLGPVGPKGDAGAAKKGAVSAGGDAEPKVPLPALDPATSPQSAVLGESFLGVGNGPAHVDGRKATVIRTSYLLPFEIVSVHLLVVLIGAAYLARAKRRRGGES
jgi:hypothetical protein